MPGKVLNCRFPHPEAAVKLFCFPWAGGGAAFYSNWGKLLPNSIEGLSENIYIYMYIKTCSYIIE